jgi:competence protein ComEA
MEYIRKYWYIILIVIAFIGYVAFSTESEQVISAHQKEWEESISPIEKEPHVDEAIKPLLFFVDIKGEIKNPGVYEVNEKSRVLDLIELAGGFTDLADQNGVNLAQKVNDEMVLYVPKIGEVSVSIPHTQQNQLGGLVNINVADKENLDSLPGIGPSKADAIIAYREENGFFQTIDELVKVPGIGEKTLDSLREHITIQ